MQIEPGGVRNDFEIRMNDSIDGTGPGRDCQCQPNYFGVRVEGGHILNTGLFPRLSFSWCRHGLYLLASGVIFGKWVLVAFETLVHLMQFFCRSFCKE